METVTERSALVNAWPSQLGISVGFAGFLALMAVISFPLPWTPVPFSLMPLGLLVAGAAQRPGFAALSVGIYLLAGALGAPIYAEGASGIKHLFGNTAGYLFGFVLVSMMVSWYVRAPRRAMPPMLTRLTLGAIAVAVIGGIAAMIRFSGTATGFTNYGDDPPPAAWGVTPSVLWALLYVTIAAGAAVTWTLRRENNHSRTFDLFIVMLGAIGVLHFCGVLVMWLVTDLDLISAIILGSVVFLPFDIIKAGVAVAASLPFLPAESEHA